MSEEWIFTFGFSHTHPATGASLAKCYVVIKGDVNSTREVMHEAFGNKWVFQYPTREAAGVERYNLREIPLPVSLPTVGTQLRSLSEADR